MRPLVSDIGKAIRQETGSRGFLIPVALFFGWLLLHSAFTPRTSCVDWNVQRHMRASAGTDRGLTPEPPAVGVTLHETPNARHGAPEATK